MNRNGGTMALGDEIAELRGDGRVWGIISGRTPFLPEHERLSHIENQVFMSNLLAFAVYIVAIFLNPVKREVVHVLRLVAVFGLWSFVGDSTTAVAGHAENEIFLNSSNDADSIANVFVITEPESLAASHGEAKPKASSPR